MSYLRTAPHNRYALPPPLFATGKTPLRKPVEKPDTNLRPVTATEHLWRSGQCKEEKTEGRKNGRKKKRKEEKKTEGRKNGRKKRRQKEEKKTEGKENGRKRKRKEEKTEEKREGGTQ